MSEEILEFKIEKNIPEIKSLRYVTTHQGRPYKYPFEKLQVGDSFLVPLETDEEYTRKINSLTSCKTLAQRALGIKMKTRRVSGGIRVWRIS